MTESIEEKIADLIARAKALGDTGIKPRSAIQNGSSLHMIIKTPEQAKAFMRSLQAARTNS
ncbi:MAG TPA: hypothetical protein VGS79_21385 [Puia sp.]|nr:hypothetical protein [Puia sp.]